MVFAGGANLMAPKRERSKIWYGGPSAGNDRAPRPSPEQFAERDNAYTRPVTIAHDMLGEPPPGRSALDQQRAAPPKTPSGSTYRVFYATPACTSSADSARVPVTLPRLKFQDGQ